MIGYYTGIGYVFEVSMDVKKIRKELTTITNRELLACQNILRLNIQAPIAIGDREDTQRRLDLVNVEIENRILSNTLNKIEE